MTKFPRKNVPDVRIKLGAACMPSELASDRATICVNTERARIFFYRFLSLDMFSGPENGDNRKMVGKVGPSKIYLKEANVYMMKIEVILCFSSKIQVL